MHSLMTKGVMLMNKEKYERVELEITEFQTQDVIMTSGLDEYEDDILNPNR